VKLLEQMSKRPSSSVNRSGVGPHEADTKRFLRALQRDALARGVHPIDATRERAVAAYHGIWSSISGIMRATAEVQRDEGIELRVQTAKALGIFSIDPGVEPLFEVTRVVGDEYGEDVTFSDLSEAIGYLAAQLC
jgi:hypothetical protein